MRLQSIREGKKEQFAYTRVAEHLWDDLLSKASKLHDIHFDTENDDAVADIRTIRFFTGPDKELDKVRVRAELRFAGGDWQAPTAYFRCQLVDGSLHWDGSRRSEFDESSLFVVIPGKDDGNSHLQKGKSGSWGPCDADDDCERPNERKCWAFLEPHLRKLAKAERNTDY